MPAVSYIVSAFNRPQHLRGCLASIQVQDDPDWECIVADNGEYGDQMGNFVVVSRMADARFRYVYTAQHATSPGWDCYWSAEYIVEHEASGEWLCFPSDDSYYMPVFQSTLLAKARAENLELVYPEMLYDRRGSADNKYHPLGVSAVNCQIDKTGFLLRKDRWIGFPDKPQVLSPSCCDGAMIDRLVAAGIRHGKVEELLVLHN